MSLILGIETSCDDTSVALVDGRTVLAQVILSQEDHAAWGGIVPELASRAHLAAIAAVVETTLERAGVEIGQIAAIAATNRPGLIGSLLVGLNVAKGMALATGRPFIAVNHIEAHLLSVLIENEVEYPYLALLVSGGHTLLYDVISSTEQSLIGATRDDAAGEAFDKGAKLLGLGYPGGPVIDRLAAEGDSGAHRFPRSMMNDASLDFSFSGVKTALRYYLRDQHQDAPLEDAVLRDVAASYQEAIVDVLVEKTKRGAKKCGRKTIALVGGVAANRRLRERFAAVCDQQEWRLLTTDITYSTDNAAMIGLVGSLRFAQGAYSPLSTVAQSTLPEAKAFRGKGRRIALSVDRGLSA